MSARPSSLYGKKDDEEIEMSAIDSKSSTENQESTTLNEENKTGVDVRKPKAGPASERDNEGKKTDEKGKEEPSDNADGTDPFSPESFAPLMTANQYSMRKTASQALMDVALMMANISQLRTLLTAGDKTEYYVLLVVMVILSLVFQLLFAVLIFIIWTRESEQRQKEDYLNTLREVTETTNGTQSVKDKIRNSLLRRKMSYQGHRLTSHLNYVTMVLVFIITVINMFITGFGIKLEATTDTVHKTSDN